MSALLSLILTSSTIDKKLEIYIKLEIELEIYRNLGYELEINKNLENFESIFEVFFVNFESVFEFFVISSFLSMVDELSITILFQSLGLVLFFCANHVIYLGRDT